MADNKAMRTCPCCGYRTLVSDSRFDLCEVCYWESDPIQFDDPTYEGGANVVSLNQARENFLRFGASDRRFIEMVREPCEEEQ